MNESTSRKMGPRETKAWDEEAKIRSTPPGFGSASFALRLQKAILADALEEALSEWEADIAVMKYDMGVACAEQADVLSRLRLVLAEVDRG